MSTVSKTALRIENLINNRKKNYFPFFDVESVLFKVKMSPEVKALVLHFLHRRREKSQFFFTIKSNSKEGTTIFADKTLSHTL